jgi:hypothetical protein
MGEESIDPLILEEILWDLLDRQYNGAGREIFGDDDTFPAVLLIGEDADRRRLDPDLQRKLPEKLSGMDGDKGNPPLPWVFVLAAYAEAYFLGQFSSIEAIDYDTNKRSRSTAPKGPVPLHFPG